MTPSEQPFVVRLDRADGMGVARFANVGHINEPVRERNFLALHSLHRLITAGTYYYWNLCFFRSEHWPPKREGRDGRVYRFPVRRGRAGWAAGS